MENLGQYSDDQLWAMLNEAENEEKYDVLIELNERNYRIGDFISASSLAELAAGVAQTCMPNAIVENARYRQGLALWKADRYRDAIEAFQAGVETYEEPDDKTELSKNQWGIASCHYYLQDYELATKWANLSTASALIGDEFGLAGLSKFLEAQALYLSDQEELALAACEEARSYRRQIQELSAVAEIDAYMARIHSYLGNYARAVDLLRNCLVLAEATSNSVSYYSYKLGNALIDLGEFDEARSHLERARRGFEELEDHGSLADCYFSICRTYNNDSDQALENVRSAISLWDALGNDTSYTRGLGKLATLLFAKDDLEAAVEINNRIIDFIGRPSNEHQTEVVGWAILRLADCYREAEEYEQALAALHSVDTFGLGSLHPGNNIFYGLKARSLYALGRHEEALGVADTALSQTVDEEVSYETAYLYEIKARVSLEQDRPDKERHLAHAIALLLAFDETHKARDLSSYFKPNFARVNEDEILSQVAVAKSEPQAPGPTRSIM